MLLLPLRTAQAPGQMRLRPYHDLPVICELNKMQREAAKAATGAQRVSEDSLKWLAWEEYLQLVADLRAECAGEARVGGGGDEAASSALLP
jgi:hypothetical protein